MVYPVPGPNDCLRGDAALPEAVRLGDFWRWAFSDLCEDYIKGIFAEWMVGTLLGLAMSERRRISFANSDLILPNGFRIEVKATAYWQSWRLLNERGQIRPTFIDPTPASRISFGSLRTRGGADGNNAATPPSYKSDLYVFCFQNELNPARWDALDLSQWEFYVLQRAELERTATKTLSLTKLRRLAGAAMTAQQLQEKMRSVLAGHAA